MVGERSQWRISHKGKELIGLVSEISKKSLTSAFWVGWVFNFAVAGCIIRVGSQCDIGSLGLTGCDFARWRK